MFFQVCDENGEEVLYPIVEFRNHKMKKGGDLQRVLDRGGCHRVFFGGNDAPTDEYCWHVWIVRDGIQLLDMEMVGNQRAFVLNHSGKTIKHVGKRWR